MMLPTLTMGLSIEKLHWQGHQRHMGDVYQPRFDILRALILARSTSPTMPTTAYDAELQRCPRVVLRSGRGSFLAGEEIL